MNQQTDTNWERQPFEAWEFFMLIAIPISFVLIGSAILFAMVIHAGG